MNRSVGAFALVLAGLLGVVANAADQVTLTFDQPQTAGISGFRAQWDLPIVLDERGMTRANDQGRFGKSDVAVWDEKSRTPKGGGTPAPGALVFDAVHRSLLVRFPNSAQKIADELNRGMKIDRAELILPFRENEFFPEGYRPAPAMSFLGDQWVKNPARWHAIAWPLRKPWYADPTNGPTFNAYINGGGYWAKYGAQDTTSDRYSQSFGPSEVSANVPQGTIDVTAILSDPIYGKTDTQRLRSFEEQGLIIRKWETYDARYLYSGYEWGTATGGRGILIGTPRLVVHFIAGNTPTEAVLLPPAVNIAALAANLKNAPKGKPTATIPSAEEIKRLADRYGFVKPQWMPDWQWLRLQEINSLSGKPWDFPRSAKEYETWIDDLLSIPPRFWVGWSSGDKASLTLRVGSAMPAYVLEHEKLYWWSFLMPDRSTQSLVHPYGPGGEKITEYYERTGDWRGNTNLFRPYCYNISTMNFNHTCPAGAMLGGSLIGAEHVVADGRNGLEQFPLRLWSWYDGTTQESIDHYYFAITLSDQKEFADFGPTDFDRLMGRNILAKSVDELAASFHPGLRRFVSRSGRTSPEYIWITLEGTTHILNTLSRNGVLHDVGNSDLWGQAFIGHDAPPERIARQSIEGPWAPEWVSHFVDDKPLPFEMTTAYQKWGQFDRTPLWSRNYMGKHYGLASVDVSMGQDCVPVMALWKRSYEPADKVQSIGSLLARYGTNIPNFTDSHRAGIVGSQGGMTATLQDKNRMILLTSPFPNNQTKDICSLQTSIALFSFEGKPPESPTWTIYVDGTPVKEFPFSVKDGQRITIKDGVSYLGLIPIPSTDLGRDAQVLITNKTRGEDKTHLAPTLLIEQYNYRSNTPLDKAAADWKKIDRAYGGFVIEMGDAEEYQSFEAFEKHFRESTLRTDWDEKSARLSVQYKTGNDELACTFRPEYINSDAEPTPTDQCFPTRSVNGHWPYLERGILRDNPFCQQGTTGRLSKGGAVVTSESGKMAYLQAEPKSGTYSGFNPLPDLSYWAMSVPGGVIAQADGQLGVTRLTLRPSESKVWLDYGLKPGTTSPTTATALLLFGFKAAPTVEINGKLRKEPLERVTLGGTEAMVIPLDDRPIAQVLPGLEGRWRKAQQALASAQDPESRPRFAQDWAIVGPFFNDYLGQGMTQVNPPEQGPIDLNATYVSKLEPAKGMMVRWVRNIKPGEPTMLVTPVDIYSSVPQPNVSKVAYAYTLITSDSERDVILNLGISERYALWLNDTEMQRYPFYRIAMPDQDRIPVRLKRGQNTLLIKSGHGGEAWKLYLRLTDVSGTPLTEGVTIGLP